MGNILFTLLASHETLGSTMGFIFVLITLYPEYQKRMQEELDQQLGERPMSEWTVEKDYQALQKGYIGAVQKEVLYIYNPGSFLLRTTVEPVIVVDAHGQPHMIPKNNLTLINNAGAARNPAVWSKPAVAAERRTALSDSQLYTSTRRGGSVRTIDLKMPRVHSPHGMRSALVDELALAEPLPRLS